MVASEESGAVAEYGSSGSLKGVVSVSAAPGGLYASTEPDGPGVMADLGQKPIQIETGGRNDSSLATRRSRHFNYAKNSNSRGGNKQSLTNNGTKPYNYPTIGIDNLPESACGLTDLSRSPEMVTSNPALIDVMVTLRPLKMARRAFVGINIPVAADAPIRT